jgi:RNA polymerase sigma-70 factor (ECF subfamily)
MTDDNTFATFVARIRAGDEQAAVELVRQYEPLIRREIRMHLDDPRLNRAFDSLDVCQSVMASFFLRTAAGEYDLERPEQLVGLLVTMARNKLASAVRREQADRRDARRLSEQRADKLDAVAAAGSGPADALAGRELLDRFRQALTDEERAIVDLRTDGLAWADVAAKLGGTAQARRMQLSRAVERVARELGVEPGDV